MASCEPFLRTGTAPPAFTTFWHPEAIQLAVIPQRALKIVVAFWRSLPLRRLWSDLSLNPMLPVQLVNPNPETPRMISKLFAIVTAASPPGCLHPNLRLLWQSASMALLPGRHPALWWSAAVCWSCIARCLLLLCSLPLGGYSVACGSPVIGIVMF